MYYSPRSEFGPFLGEGSIAFQYGTISGAAAEVTLQKVVKFHVKYLKKLAKSAFYCTILHKLVTSSINVLQAFVNR